MKKIILTFGILFIILTSCSSNNENETSTDQNLVLCKSYTFGRNDQTITKNFIYNGNKIVSSNSTGSINEKYTYTGNLITKIDFFLNDDLDQRNTYAYDSEGRLETFVNLIYGLQTTENCKKVSFVYNIDGTTSYSKFVGNLTSQTSLQETGKVFYTNGEITKVESIIGTTTVIQNFVYDDKNNPFKNVLGFPEISFTDGQVYNGKFRNIVTRSSISTANFSSTIEYIYNTNNFPTTALEASDNFSYSANQYFYE